MDAVMAKNCSLSLSIETSIFLSTAPLHPCPWNWPRTDGYYTLHQAIRKAVPTAWTEVFTCLRSRLCGQWEAKRVQLTTGCLQALCSVRLTSADQGRPGLISLKLSSSHHITITGKPTDIHPEPPFPRRGERNVSTTGFNGNSWIAVRWIRRQPEDSGSCVNKYLPCWNVLEPDRETTFQLQDCKWSNLCSDLPAVSEISWLFRRAT